MTRFARLMHWTAILGALALLPGCTRTWNATKYQFSPGDQALHCAGVEGCAWTTQTTPAKPELMVISYEGIKRQFLPQMKYYYALAIDERGLPAGFGYGGPERLPEKIQADITAEQYQKIAQYKFTEDEEKKAHDLMEDSKRYIPANAAPPSVSAPAGSKLINESNVYLVPFSWYDRPFTIPPSAKPQNLRPGQRWNLEWGGYRGPLDARFQVAILPCDQPMKTGDRVLSGACFVVELPILIVTDVLMVPFELVDYLHLPL